MSNQQYFPTWESLDSRPMPSWFNRAKFGIFIHWGVFSVPAWRKIDNSLFGSYAEWYYASVYGHYRNNDDDFHVRMFGKDFRYRDFAPFFKAELFNPKAWAELFKKSGAKYVVLTTKHHEGYCMWPTDNVHKKNWNCMEVGPHRDLMGDLTKAVRAEGLKMGVYYSMIDWETNWSHRPEGGYFVPERDRREFGIDEKLYPDEILIPQLKELVMKYQPSLIFSDGGEWDLSEEYSKAKEFLAWLYNNAPNKDEVVVNDRFCVGMPGHHGDYFSTEYNDKEGFGHFHPWEESRGIGKSYGFNRAERLEDYCSSYELIVKLVSLISKGGNLLLNVGPTADGRIPVLQEERLRDIGRWMEVNSKAVYDSRVCDNLSAGEDFCFFTHVEDKDYLFLTKWLENELTVKIKRGKKPTGCKLLTKDGGIDIPLKFVDDGVFLLPPVNYKFGIGLEYVYTYQFAY